VNCIHCALASDEHVAVADRYGPVEVLRARAQDRGTAPVAPRCLTGPFERRGERRGRDELMEQLHNLSEMRLIHRRNTYT